MSSESKPSFPSSWSTAAMITAFAAGAILSKPLYTLAKGLFKKTSGVKHAKAIGLSDELHEYLIKHSCRHDAGLEEIQKRTYTDNASKNRTLMMSPLDSASLLKMLCQLVGAKKVCEVGVFTGFTTLAMARALPKGGKIVALDISSEFTDVGKPVWEKEGVSDLVDLRIMPATKSMENLVATESGTFDVIFIDADKSNYQTYYEHGLKLLRKGGVILVDNVLWHGKVIDEKVQDEDTNAIRKLNKFIFDDNRVDVCMIPTSDGVTIARKL